jgi:hypothetical protein
MANDPISDIVAEMSGKVTERQLREAKKAQKTAQQEAQAEEDEFSRRNAAIMLDERDARDRKWKAEHLGAMTPQQYRNYIRQEYGYDPLV